MKWIRAERWEGDEGKDERKILEAWTAAPFSALQFKIHCAVIKTGAERWRFFFFCQTAAASSAKYCQCS